MTETDIEAEEIRELKKKTSREDRLSEGPDAEELEAEEDVDYTPIDEVVLRENADKDIDALKRETTKGERVEEEDLEEADLHPYEEYDFEYDEEAVQEPYCGNCEAIEFKKHKGDPRPHCSLHDSVTELKPGYVCGGYVPQGMDDP